MHVEDVQCLAAVGGDIHLHPQVAQHGRGHLAVHRHVLDEQHARGPRRGRRMRSNTVDTGCGRDSSRCLGRAAQGAAQRVDKACPANRLLQRRAHARGGQIFGACVVAEKGQHLAC